MPRRGNGFPEDPQGAVTLNLAIIVLLIGIAFAGGFVGSIISGSSLITFTVLAFLDLPARMAVGTLKLAIAVEGLSSLLAYWKGGATRMRPALLAIAFSILGSVVGSQIVLSLTDITAKILVIFLLCVGALLPFLVSPPSNQRRKTINPRFHNVLSVLAGTALGIYIGMLGIASALLTIPLLMTLYGLPLLEASGTARSIIFATNLAAFAMYASYESVDLVSGLPIAIGTGLGGWAGGRAALRIGDRELKAVFVATVIVTVFKLLLDLL